MIKFTQGNLLESDAEALVNTVNTVGVMGKGIALMFKEAFPENFRQYEKACAAKSLRVGEMFVTERSDLYGPKWIINFPTKAHWRFPSKLEWIAEGLDDLKDVVLSKQIKSIALPPLGAGNGGLEWVEVRELIVEKLSALHDVDIMIYEPMSKYHNVAKRTGVENLTPARALIAELVRRYSIIGLDCSILEIQKLGYFVERFSLKHGLGALKFEFGANKYGPYSHKLKHLLNSLDGSYLHCERRLSDAGPFEPIYFDDSKKNEVDAYFSSPESRPFRPALEATSRLIDGFESPLGMELLGTVDWMVDHDGVRPELDDVRARLPLWTGGREAGARKLGLFEDRMIRIALDALRENGLIAGERHAERI